MGANRSVYQSVGGMETFRRLADVFYTRVEADPLLRPMFPDEFTPEIREHLALFIAQFFGGPQEYSEKRGHPRLRMRHLPFSIGRAESDAWLGHMHATLDEVGIPEPALSVMRGYFAQSAAFLINRPEE